jgi:hypothetical protein
MEERVTTSFIPKESLHADTTRRRTGSPAAFANIVAGAILILAILAAGGVFSFEKYTESAIQSKQDSLARSREAFEPATILELSRLDGRISAAEKLLKTHTSASRLFDELEKVTLSSVKYDTFEYSASTPGHLLLTMTGEAQSYNAVALQSDAFSKSTIVTDPIFSNVTVGKSGAITFNFTGVIDPTRMLYAPATATSTPQ